MCVCMYVRPSVRPSVRMCVRVASYLDMYLESEAAFRLSSRETNLGVFLESLLKKSPFGDTFRA